MTVPLDAIRLAHTLRTDGDAWRYCHRAVCVRLHLPLTTFSVRALIVAHAALFPRHRYPLGPATGGEGA